jgi:hypothetical protein
LKCVERKNGPACWEFLWREIGPTGKLVRRTSVIGTVEEYPTADLAHAAIDGLRPSINEQSNRNCCSSKLLKTMVGAWGFEPPRPLPCQVVLDRGPSLLKSTSTKFPRRNSHCMHCIHCFKCTFCTFLCANLCAHLYSTF